MDIGRSLTFYTEDPRWKEKLGIGIGMILVSTLLSFVLVGVVGFIILMGYSVRLLQNVRDGKTHPLPEWDQWGDDLARGFKLFVVTLIWGIPLFFVMIPTMIGGAMTDSGGDGVVFIGVLLITCGTCLSIIYGLLYAFLTPGITVLFAEDEKIGSGLRVREVWQWSRERVGEVLIVLVLIVAVSIAMSIIAPFGIILCGVGLLVTVPASILLTYLIQYHLFGQLARSGKALVPAAAAAPVDPFNGDRWSEEIVDVVKDEEPTDVL